MDQESSTSREYWLIVIELDDVMTRRDVRKPNLYIAKTITPPEKRFDTIKLSKKSHWYTNHVIRLRSDLGPSRSFKSSEDAKEACSKLVKKLGSEGYTVNRNAQVWTVYVIELTDTATTHPGKAYLYVGETSKTPEERFKQHREGTRNKRGRLYANVVKKHGVRLRPDLAPRKKYFDQASDKRAEKDHFDLLKARGYNVEGGH